MFSTLVATSEAVLLISIAFGASWGARAGIRTLTRRAVRRAQRRNGGTWRVRLDRRGDDGQADARKRQRADAVARMLGHVVTVAIVATATVVGLNLLGVDAVFAISSAGFIGFALALSAQDVVKDFLAGIRVLLEDRYGAGDMVVMSVGGNEVRGTVDLVGAASVRLRTADGATWHAGHHVIESVANESQLPAVTDIPVPLSDWTQSDPKHAADRLAEATNDVGLTGVVFVRDIETHSPIAPDGTADSHAPTTAASEIGDDTVLVAVKSNRPLSPPQADLVRDRLLGN